tara:strand:+ start:150 stop:416 length:267 start_codon:yes stop_codon:yes gene_type:complete
MFWGLNGCPPETVERVLKNYNDIVAKGKEAEAKKKAAEAKKKTTEKNYEKFMELVKKNPPRGFKDILEYSMILSYYTKELDDKTLRLM